MWLIMWITQLMHIWNICLSSVSVVKNEQMCITLSKMGKLFLFYICYDKSFNSWYWIINNEPVIQQRRKTLTKNVIDET